MSLQSKSALAAAVIIAYLSLQINRAQADGDADGCVKGRSQKPAQSEWRGQWYILTTENFEISCEKTAAPAKKLAERAESLRNDLKAKWLGEASLDAWQPRCEIFLFGSKRSYVATVGPGGEHTVGSSLVTAAKNRITSRRIDLLGDQTEFLAAALPHELTHVILRDRFVSTPPPRWADEGMAMLADTEAKQERHHKDLLDALASGKTFRAANLLAMEDYPPAERVGAFYGESIALTKFLVERTTPQQFVQFVAHASQDGYDSALVGFYGINGAWELDRQWRQSLNHIQLASYSGR
jgi:hypothetical protein